MFTANSSDKGGLQACEQCKRRQKICTAQFESHERCIDCARDEIKCSFVDFEPGAPPRSTSEMMRRHLWEDHSRATTASSSSVGSSNSWGQRSWITTAPSSYSSYSESIPPLARRAQYSPNTPPDSGFGSYTEQYQPTPPSNQEKYMGCYGYVQGARSGHETLGDSGLSSTEKSRPSSPLASPTSPKFRRGASKRRARSQFSGPYTPPSEMYNFGASSADNVLKTCTNCLTQNTAVWKDSEGQTLCNTCGRFLKFHGVVRPLETDVAKKRNRGSGVNMGPKGYSLNSLAEKKPNTALSGCALLVSCTQQCAIVVRRLEDVEKTDKGGMVALLLPLSLSVIKLRLHLWGQIAAESLDDSAVHYSSVDHPFQTLVKVNGIICELDVVVNALIQDTEDESTHPPRNWDKVSKLLEELINLVNILHTGLPDIWQETARWALVADLLVHRSLDVISQGLKARFGGNRENLFTRSLGPEVPRNLSSMFSLLDNRNGTSAPMSYEYGLLDLNDLVYQGWFDPGIRVYIQRGSNGSPEKGIISVDIVACNGGETPKQAMDSQSALGLQKRLQLHKPDEFRVLALAGYLENTAMRQVEILYQAPEWALPPYAPISLFKLTTEGQLPDCMGTRIAIARKLACAVLHFHTSDWIHGNIIDRNIIFFIAKTGPNLLEPFLCNFAPYPVREASKCDALRASEEFRRARGHDIYQMAFVILGLVLGDEVVRQLRIFEFSLASSTTKFEGVIDRSALLSLKNSEAALLFKKAMMSCISGGAAQEGIIEEDEEFKKCSGFYWRVVRPLDHCLSLLVRDMHPQDVERIGLDISKFRTDREALNLYPYRNEGRGGSLPPVQGSTKVLRKESSHIPTPMDGSLEAFSDIERLERIEKLQMEFAMLEDRKRVLGGYRPGVLILMSHQLALAYLNLGQFEKVDKLLVGIQEALKVLASDYLVLDHSEILITLGSLASACRGLGKPEMAEGLERAVLEMKKRIQGKNNPVTENVVGLSGGNTMQSDEQKSSSLKLDSTDGEERVRILEQEQPRDMATGDEQVTYLTMAVTPLFESEMPEEVSKHPLKNTSGRPISQIQEVSTTRRPKVAGEDGRGITTVSKMKADIDLQDRKKVYPVQATASTIRLWKEKLLPQLEKILEHYLPKIESASIDLLGIGTSRESSRPTIVITCESVRQVKVHLRKWFAYDESIFDLKIRKGSVRRSTGRRAREKRNTIRRSTGSSFQDCPNRAYQEKPLSGASIGARLDGRPLPPGTYGGLILVDSQPYGITCHHLLDPEPEGEEETDEEDIYDISALMAEEGIYQDTLTDLDLESVSHFASSSGSDVNSMPVYWDESDESDNEEYEEHEDMLDVEELGAVYYSSATGNTGEIVVSTEEPTGDIGDIPGFPKNHGKDIVITQPAQDDVLDQEPFGCEKSIRNYKLGTILASSGIRRVMIGAEKHEMDWALVQIEEQRLVARNIIRGGGKYLRRAGPPDLEPCAIVPMAELSELRVHATGRTSGLQGGMISQAMSSVRLYGRETFSKSWHVVGNLGIPGDSGSWVVDNDSGRICGHVLARCSIKRVSYIVPMELLLEDIKETLGAKSVRLPSVATEVNQLLDEALAQYGMVDSNSNTRQEMDRLLCPGPDPPAGSSDDITPLAY